MQPGSIFYAQHDGAFVIKLKGDVRLTLCKTLDDFIETMFSHPKFLSVMIDLSETEGIDSTTLGLMAKLSIQAQARFGQLPVVFSTNPDITRILLSMGFDKVFDIHEEAMEAVSDLSEVPVRECGEEKAREKILEAHRILMGLNAENRLKFTDLVVALERSERNESAKAGPSNAASAGNSDA